MLRSALHAISNRRSLPCYGELPSTSEDSIREFYRANVSRCNFISLNGHKIANDFLAYIRNSFCSLTLPYHISFNNLIHCTALHLPGTTVFSSSLTSFSGLIKSRIIFPSSSLVANHLWHGNSTVSPVLESSMTT